MVVKVKRFRKSVHKYHKKTRTTWRTSTLEVDVMESGLYSHINIAPRLKPFTINCGDLDHKRKLYFRSVYQIRKPERSGNYAAWLTSHPPKP